MKEFQTVVIGAGPAGYEAALELAKAGIKTLLIDKSKEHIGGVCLNEGCVSTKNYLQYAEFASKASYFGSRGLELEMKGLDIKALAMHTTSLKDELRTGVAWLLEQAGVEMLYGSASFVDANHISVSDETIEFDHCIIATGSKTQELPILPIDGKRIISSREVFELQALPRSIVIVGGGLIGCEFATFFNAFGVEVTMVVRGTQLLSNEDEDVSKALLRAFKKRSINVLFSASIANAEINEEKVKLVINVQNEEHIECDLVLSATGRIPYTDGLQLENAGVKYNDKGFIEVNESFQTTQEHIYAVGDCIDTFAYAHTAYTEGSVASHNIITGEALTNTHISPSTIFSDPQVATCGLNEKEAKSQGLDIDVKKAYFKANAKAKIVGDDSGFIKIIASSQDGTVFGASMVGAEAVEIIHILVAAVERKVTFKELTGMIYAHPTISEIIRNL
ncbi:MAG TPA: dihydrolipoyl dehydrogenase [Epsilonproteobacteria bacterium]|nr:dihydrolipoyl dehydrogenase [Campylobacterota bacterium]